MLKIALFGTASIAGLLMAVSAQNNGVMVAGILMFISSAIATTVYIREYRKVTNSERRPRS